MQHGSRSGSCIRPQKTLRGLSTPSLVATEFERHSHHPAFHSTAGSPPGDVHTAAHTGYPLRSIPAASCSPNLHRPAKCDETTPCRTEASATRRHDKSRARLLPRSRLLLAPYYARRQKDASQNGMKPRIARRSSQVLCARKRPITPVSEYERLKALSRARSTGHASTPRRPFPPLDTPHPRHPPRTLTPKGGKGTLGGSCCFWPTLHRFISFW